MTATIISVAVTISNAVLLALYVRRTKRLRQRAENLEAIADQLKACSSALGDLWDDGWEARAAVMGPACPDDYNPYRQLQDLS